MSRRLIALLSCAVLVGCASGPDPSATDSAPGPTGGLPFEVSERLVDRFDRVELDAIDGVGSFGAITLIRGRDVGGYALNAIDPEAFVIEVSVTYETDRQPSADFGRPDWVVVGEDGLPVGGFFSPAFDATPEVQDPADPELGTWPGAVDVTGELIRGTMYLLIPRDAANERLLLVYRPASHPQGVLAMLLREAGAAPEPVPTASPIPTPEPLAYVDRSGLPFSVIDSAEADALFASTNTCTEAVGGYTIAFPSTWFTNEPTPDVPACSWFAPAPFDVEGPTAPPEVVITISAFEGGIGFVHQPDYSVQDQVTIGGWSASRTEEIGGFGADGPLPRSRYQYGYIVFASVDPLGLKVGAGTSNDRPGDYALHKAVLDRIMASMTLEQEGGR
jgi:hypothetical protein